MEMQAKNVLYAAVGAPVVAAKKVGDQVGALRERVNKGATTYTEAAEKAMNNWATEGEKMVSRISDGAVVEEISQKMDLDQAKEQVSKLRDQLEDMLDTWRHSFRPEEKADPAKKPAAKTTAAKKPATKKPAAEKTAASSTTKTAAAKKSSTAKAS
jgi:topoisomerase IA-like protein